MNLEDIASDPYSSTMMNENFLSWFLNVVTRNFRVLRGGCLLMYGNPKECEVAEHISPKVEVNPHILLTLKKNPYEA